MELITPSSGLLFWMVLIFGIVFFMLAKWGFPVITGMVAKRTEHIEQSLKDAEMIKVELATMEAKKREMLNSTRTEQNAMLEDAEKEARNIIEEARRRSLEETAEIKKRAETEIEVSRRLALEDIKAEVANVVVEVSGKILRKKLETNESQMALIDEMVGEVEKDMELKVD